MNDWWFCVLGVCCSFLYQQVVAEWNVDPTEPVTERQTEKCSFFKKIFSRCLKKEVIVTTTPTPVSDDSSSKSLGFSFSAFVITLFTSLAVALTGAFACWCCRAFCRNTTFGGSSSSHPVTVSTHQNDSMVTESLVGDHAPQSSLPSYVNATNDPVSTPVPSAPFEEPPPSYASLFTSPHEIKS